MINKINILQVIVNNDETFFEIPNLKNKLKQSLFAEKHTSLFDFIMYYGTIKQIKHSIEICHEDFSNKNFNKYISFHAKNNNTNHFIYLFELFNNNNTIANNPLNLMDVLINYSIRNKNHNQLKYIINNLKCRSTFYFALYIQPLFKSDDHFYFITCCFDEIMKKFDPIELVNVHLKNKKKHPSYPKLVSLMLEKKVLSINNLDWSNEEKSDLLPQLL